MTKTQEPRVVDPGHGWAKAMRFRFRCRIESRTRRTWFGFGPEIEEHRYVLERYHIAWEDEEYGPWTTISNAQETACRLLDSIESTPDQQKNVKTFYI